MHENALSEIASSFSHINLSHQLFIYLTYLKGGCLLKHCNFVELNTGHTKASMHISFHKHFSCNIHRPIMQLPGALDASNIYHATIANSISYATCSHTGRLCPTWCCLKLEFLACLYMPQETGVFTMQTRMKTGQEMKGITILKPARRPTVEHS